MTRHQQVIHGLYWRVALAVVSGILAEYHALFAQAPQLISITGRTRLLEGKDCIANSLVS